MAKTWRAARAVVFDTEGKTAIIDVRDGAYYKIPGGGINPGEGKRDAAIRETVEDAGCDIEIISKIGEYEFVGADKRKYHSTCYLARKIRDNKGPNFDDWEMANRFKIMWVIRRKRSGFLKVLELKMFLGRI